MYKQGVIYIWQTKTPECTFLNGTETTVTGPYHSGAPWWPNGWPTSTPVPAEMGSGVFFAEPGDLRPKFDKPTDGEIRIMEEFKREIEAEV